MHAFRIYQLRYIIYRFLSSYDFLFCCYYS